MMAAKAANMGPDLMRFIEKSLLLQTLDAVWKEHLYALDHLRQGIGLRAYGQRDPLNEYKSEAFALFNAMLDDLKERVTTMLSRVELAPDQPPAPVLPPMPFSGMVESHPEPVAYAAGERELVPAGTAMEVSGGSAAGVAVAAQTARADQVDPNDPATWRNAGRNAPCPCGSGKKYKHCHGRLG
jgi:preprotein translocase subunit SecA